MDKCMRSLAGRRSVTNNDNDKADSNNNSAGAGSVSNVARRQRPRRRRQRNGNCRFRSAGQVIALLALVLAGVALTLIDLSERSTVQCLPLDLDLNELSAEAKDELAMSEVGEDKLEGGRAEERAATPPRPAKIAPESRAPDPPGRPRPVPEPTPTPEPAKPAAGWRERLKAGAIGGWQTVSVKLPEYFNFDEFRKKLGRSYNSDEFFYRKARFLSRCMEIFKTRVRYRLGLTSHLEDVNKFADRSPNEVRRMFMSAPPIEMARGVAPEEYLERARREERERKEWDAELTSESALGFYATPGDTETAPTMEPEPGDEVSIITERQAERQLEALLDSLGLDREAQAAFREEMAGAGVETLSESSIMAEADGARSPQPLPRPGRAKSSDEMEVDGAGENERPYAAPQSLAPRNSIDWSQHGCFHKIYDQGDGCGNCYVMASTALAEFYKCSEREDKITPRKFSKEYVMNCAQKYSPNVLGCSGGSIMDTLRFLAEAGAYNIRSWRDRRQAEVNKARRAGQTLSEPDQRCPLNPFLVPFRLWGEIELELNPRLVHPNDWLLALEDGPLVASVQMPTSAMAYAGGVHSGEGCATTRNWHAMLLVGYGVDERGLAYWRFRNSWGPDWGDAGHFNLAMSVPGACLTGGVRVYREPLAGPQ